MDDPSNQDELQAVLPFLLRSSAIAVERAFREACTDLFPESSVPLQFRGAQRRLTATYLGCVVQPALYKRISVFGSFRVWEAGFRPDRAGRSGWALGTGKAKPGEQSGTFLKPVKHSCHA